MGPATGLFWVGPIYRDGGYGSVARNYILSMLAAGVPVRVAHRGPARRDLIDPATVAALEACENRDVGPRPVGVLHWTPDLIALAGIRGVSAQVNCSLFETHSIPWEWSVLCNAMDQVWVPSAFNVNTYERGGVRREKLRAIPYPIDTDFWSSAVPRRAIHGASGFVFLYVLAYDWRKGFDLLLKAYASEFKGGEDVTLVMKVHAGESTREEALREIIASGAPEYVPGAAGAPRVIFLMDTMDQAALRSLYASCDLFVSTDRASGWGMPCMEAMSMGRPAAAIDWGGSREFMTHENSFLIPTTGLLEPVHRRLRRGRYEYHAQRWPGVEVSAVRRVLREAFENRLLLREKAERGMADVRSHLTFQRVGEQFRTLLEDFGELEEARKAPPELSRRVWWGTALWSLRLRPWRKAAWGLRVGKGRGWLLQGWERLLDGNGV